MKKLVWVNIKKKHFYNRIATKTEKICPTSIEAILFQYVGKMRVKRRHFWKQGQEISFIIFLHFCGVCGETNGVSPARHRSHHSPRSEADCTEVRMNVQK